MTLQRQLTRLLISCPSVLAVTVLFGTALTPVVAADEPPKPDLKSSVTLIGATDAASSALSVSAPLGRPVKLFLFVKPALKDDAQGVLTVSAFKSGDQVPDVVAAKLFTDGNPADSVTVKLNKVGQVPIGLEIDHLHPSKRYTGTLMLTSGEMTPRTWDITLIVGGVGTIAADPVGTLKFMSIPFYGPIDPSFSFSLRDKSGDGPYRHLRVQLESTAAAGSKDIRSNFNLNSFSFWQATKTGNCAEYGSQKIDLEGRLSDGNDLVLAGVQSFEARIGPLSPGEYSGTLRFTADGTDNNATDAKLPLVIQIRHHWFLPISVILLGSFIGWLSSKYFVAIRNGLNLERRIQDARCRMDFLARAGGRVGWEFPSESGSLGFERVLVALSQLNKLTHSNVHIVFHSTEIEQGLTSAQKRLSALESLHDVRLRVQPIADGRPAAQLAIGKMLRRATDLLDLPTFEDSELTKFNKVLEGLEAWTNATTVLATYRQAVLDRRNDNKECPQDADLEHVPEGDLKTEIKRLLQLLPADDAMANLDLVGLNHVDENLARCALIWRERENARAGELVHLSSSNPSLGDLFKAVDSYLWQELKDRNESHDQSQKLVITYSNNPLTFEVVEIRLTSNVPAFDMRMLIHPLRVEWQIEEPGQPTRKVETDGLGLVQYFSKSGKVTVTASLIWGSNAIRNVSQSKFTVEENPEYQKRGVVRSAWAEFGSIAAAALFAVVTAIGTQYDSTFGTMTQYFGLFIWAAGAGTGGNLFSQLGTTATSTVGGTAATLK